MIINLMNFFLVVIPSTYLPGIEAPPSSYSSRGFDYLKRYGYMDESQSISILDQTAISDAARMFQKFAGLPESGMFDERTLQKMSQKRCGNKDIVQKDKISRKKRFALQGSKWNRPNLTYKITQYTRDLTISQINREIAIAIGWWALHSPLTFVQVPVSTAADIEIRFTTGEHGDNDPFDDNGQILAHAFFPNAGGDAHFDDAETWLLRPAENGVSLRIIAAHEFGHSLGLEHSTNGMALMAPFYNENSNNLAEDDISAIQKLYQKLASTTAERSRTLSSSTTTRQRLTRSRDTPSVCNGRFDAITQLSNGTTFAFQGEQYWRLNQLSVDAGYPQRISGTWRYLRTVDAALSFGSHIELFYKGIVYRFVDRRLESYPRFISSAYRGLPRNLTRIDAVFRYKFNGITSLYFITGNQYWRFNNETNRVDKGYPRPLSVWNGLPDRIDAAFQWNNRTYFFSDGLYYRYDDSTVNVAHSRRRPYPRRTDRWWLHCIDDTLNFTETVFNEEDAQSDLPENSTPEFVFSFILLMTASIFVITTNFLN